MLTTAPSVDGVSPNSRVQSRHNQSMTNTTNKLSKLGGLQTNGGLIINGNINSINITSANQ
jgi:hypothetical protein